MIAGNSGSKDDKEWFANLKHPDNAFLLKIIIVFRSRIRNFNYKQLLSCP